jgi:WD40 repeat protein
VGHEFFFNLQCPIYLSFSFILQGTPSDDRTLKVWDLETGEHMRTMEGHTGSVSAVAVTNDGSRQYRHHTTKHSKYGTWKHGRFSVLSAGKVLFMPVLFRLMGKTLLRVRLRGECISCGWRELSKY